MAVASIAAAGVSAAAGIAGAAISAGAAGSAADKTAQSSLVAAQMARQYGGQALANTNSLWQPVRDRGDAGYWGLQNAITQSDRNTQALGQMFSPYIRAGQQGIGGINAAIAKSGGVFDQLRGSLNPYLAAGQSGLAGQQRFLNQGPTLFSRMTPEQIMAGPEYQAMIREGENAILQNASATGGLRGGDTQNALANFRQNTLAQLVGAEFDRGMQTANFNEGTRLNQIGAYGNLANSGMVAGETIGNLNNAATGNALQGYGGMVNAGMNSGSLLNDAMQANIRTRQGIWGGVYDNGINALNSMNSGMWDYAKLASGAAQGAAQGQAQGAWGNAMATNMLASGIGRGVGTMAGAIPWGSIFGSGSGNHVADLLDESSRTGKPAGGLF